MKYKILCDVWKGKGKDRRGVLRTCTPSEYHKSQASPHLPCICNNVIVITFCLGVGLGWVGLGWVGSAGCGVRGGSPERNSSRHDRISPHLWALADYKLMGSLYSNAVHPPPTTPHTCILQISQPNKSSTVQYSTFDYL
ncbi:hypothetical protein L211DRAFT_504847 [Terfezia boudieri ATCC MYA-4762]|uniref:Uncharacterized protein n=1 Tax=Terfezia boudieri ATCC MYA-4762 TaxID=1051890 RepID=A0A3N4LD01_9PEZI|nr:hypothetical protein L211DRAFT_504847 [Terfezia boudieri ATCC MYA-4762]